MRGRPYPRMNDDRRKSANAWLLYMGDPKKPAFSVHSPRCIRPIPLHSALWNAPRAPTLSFSGTPRIWRQLPTTTRARPARATTAAGPQGTRRRFEPYSGNGDPAGGRDGDRDGPAGGRLGDRVGGCRSGGAEVVENGGRSDRHRDPSGERDIPGGVGASPDPDRAGTVHEVVVHPRAIDVGADALIVPDRELPALVQPCGDRLRLPLERGGLQVGHEKGHRDRDQYSDDGHEQEELDKL